MDIGMLWYDADARRTLNEKVARAVEHYKAKYGATPTVCFVNPAVLKDAPRGALDVAGRRSPSGDGVLLRPSRAVMANHFWIGVARTRTGNGNGAAAHGKNGQKGRRKT